jgi:hypothetical protein
MIVLDEMHRTRTRLIARRHSGRPLDAWESKLLDVLTRLLRIFDPRVTEEQWRQLAELAAEFDVSVDR